MFQLFGKGFESMIYFWCLQAATTQSIPIRFHLCSKGSFFRNKNIPSGTLFYVMCFEHFWTFIPALLRSLVRLRNTRMYVRQKPLVVLLYYFTNKSDSDLMRCFIINFFWLVTSDITNHNHRLEILVFMIQPKLKNANKQQEQ